ncbi:MAG: cation:proton antiporter [Elusimicrobia bacterium]|nr:cation:proton antiporter [Elusimicrobiota bacterium]
MLAHSPALIATIAASFSLALLLGFGASRLKLPPLAGYLLAGVLIGPGTPGFVVAEENRDLVEELRRQGQHAVAGDAAQPNVLVQAHIARARTLVLAIPDAARARRMVELARMLNPRVRILIRAHSDEEAELLRRENAGETFVGEQELADSMAREILGA